jgi:hypothetical protein
MHANASNPMMPVSLSSDNANHRAPASETERPQTEPEIIPPGAYSAAELRQEQIEALLFVKRGARMHALRLGPLGAALVVLAAGFIALLGLIVLVGAAFFGALAIGAVILGALAARLFRLPLRH